MKKLTMVLCTVSTLLMAQDAAGNYKLSGLDVQYYSAARNATPINVSDIYGAGVGLTINQIDAGQIFGLSPPGLLLSLASLGKRSHLISRTPLRVSWKSRGYIAIHSLQDTQPIIRIVV